MHETSAAPLPYVARFGTNHSGGSYRDAKAHARFAMRGRREVHTVTHSVRPLRFLRRCAPLHVGCASLAIAAAPDEGPRAAVFGTGEPGASPAAERDQRQAGNEDLLVHQPVTNGDEGIGPLLLLAISSSCPYGSAAADDFTLDKTSYVSRVSWEGIYFGAASDFPGDDQSIDIAIYEDDGTGNAGALMAHYPDVDFEKAMHARPAIFDTNPVYSFTANLEPAVLIEEGKRCWIAINVNPAGPSGPAFGWMVSPFGNAADTAAPDQPLQTQQTSCAALPATGFIPGSNLGLDADLAFSLYAGCAPDDCDCDGVSNADEIAQGLASDCNENGIPDSCEIIFGDATDCDNDGVLDACQMQSIVDSTSERAEPVGYGHPQSIEFDNLPPAMEDVVITLRSRGDYSHSNEWLSLRINDQPFGLRFKITSRDCETPPSEETIELTAEEFNDLAADGRLDFTFEASNTVDPFLCGQPGWIDVNVRYRFGEPHDCNENGVYDACDIASGVSSDCNADGVPDECQLDAPVTGASPQIFGIGQGFPRDWTFLDLPTALSEVVFTIEASGDFDSAGEYLDITLNGAPLGRAYEQGGLACPGEPDVATFAVSAAEFNQMIAGAGRATINAAPSVSVNADYCAGSSSIAFSIYYLAADAADCNSNGVLDSCEFDANGNGLPDACDLAGDINGDGVVNSEDLAALLSSWGTSNPAADLNGDGLVDAMDLAILLTAI